MDLGRIITPHRSSEAGKDQAVVANQSMEAQDSSSRMCRPSRSSSRQDSLANLGLLDLLPYEIRHMIYLYVIGQEEVRLIRAQPLNRIRTSSFYREYEPHSQFPLLHICRQIYHESSEVVYACTSFVIANDNGPVFLLIFIDFTRMISPRHLNAIRRLRFLCLGASFCNIDGHPEVVDRWKAVWDIMTTRMDRLMTVEFSIHSLIHPSLGLSKDVEWTAPILKLRSIKNVKCMFRSQFKKGSYQVEEFRSDPTRLQQQLKRIVSDSHGEV